MEVIWGQWPASVWIWVSTILSQLQFCQTQTFSHPFNDFDVTDVRALMPRLFVLEGRTPPPREQRKRALVANAKQECKSRNKISQPRFTNRHVFLSTWQSFLICVQKWYIRRSHRKGDMSLLSTEIINCRKNYPQGVDASQHLQFQEPETNGSAEREVSRHLIWTRPIGLKIFFHWDRIPQKARNDFHCLCQ